MHKNAHILVIEPDSAIRDFVSMALTDEGYCVAVTNNGIDALVLTETFHPDLIIWDVVVRAQDGANFLQFYRASFPPIPILAWGTSPLAERRARALGATDFLQKPFDLEDLFSYLSRHL